jgi:hypothetical protein
MPSRLDQGVLCTIAPVRLLYHPPGDRLLSREVLALTVPEDSASSEIELLRLDRRDVNVSGRTVSTSSQLPNQPIGALR